MGAATPIPARPLRILHSVGHLSRGGIENWLYYVVRRLDGPLYKHHVMVWTLEQEAFTADFRAAGVTVHALPNRINPIVFACKFRRLLRNAGPFDIVHTHGTQFHGFIMLMASISGIGNRIAHSHTDIQPVLHSAGRGYRAYAWLGHALIRLLATKGFAVSEKAAVSMFGQAWRNDRRWQVLFCGVDLSPFRAEPDRTLRQVLGISNESRVIGHVGRFEKQKNHLFLIEIIAAACRLDPMIRFLLIGDGSLHASCVAEIGRLGLALSVIFIRDCRTVPRHMVSAMDAFVLPSLYEGLALVAVEAQAAGLACVLSDRVSLEAAIITDRVHYLPLDLDAEGWARKLLSLPPRLDNCNPSCGDAIASAGFDIEDSVRHLAAAYDRTVSSTCKKVTVISPGSRQEAPRS